MAGSKIHLILIPLYAVRGWWLQRNLCNFSLQAAANKDGFWAELRPVAQGLGRGCVREDAGDVPGA